MINETLFKAVETGKPDEVEKALTEEKINAATYYGAKSIVLAAKQENNEILKLLLKNGEKIDRESFWRRTSLSALLNAVRAENTETVKLLLEYGADTDKKILNNPLLLYAINAGNREIETLLIEHGVDISKKNLAISNDISDNTKKTKFCYEDGIFIPEKSSRDNIFIQYVKEGKIKKIKDLLEEGVSEKALLGAVDVALEKDRWDIAIILSEYSDNREVDIYTECIKKMFLKSSYTGDTEKVKFYLEKLIENAVGVLADETDRSTLEIALENNPEDIIKILSNYGFHENALQHAYKCLLSVGK